MTPEAFMQSLWLWISTFLSQLVPHYILPNLQIIIQVIILLVVAYIVGKIVKVIIVKILSVIGLKKITARTWTDNILKVTGYRGTVVELIGDMVKWLIYILFLALIIQTIGLPGIADIFTQIAVFLPRFIGAILIIVIGFIIADFFGKVFEEAGRRFLEEEIISRISGGLIKYSIALIVIIMALSLIGLDTISLNIMFIAVLACFVTVLILGIKDIFPNFSAGIHAKKAFKPGDYIKIGEYSGTVEKIDALTIVLRNKDKRITIPNSWLLNNPIERKFEKK